MAERNRFVLLHHHLGDGGHWDLMFELGAALTTWQVPRPPEELNSGRAVPARRIGDHRRAYLDYEGPVSNNRGHVTRVDCGEYAIYDRRENVWLVRIEGVFLKGTFRINADDNPSGDWTIQRLSE